MSTPSPVTGDDGKFSTIDLGVLEIPTAGSVTLGVKPVPDARQPINLGAVVRSPVE